MMNKFSKEYLINILNSGKRIDGRGLTDYRNIEVEYGVSKHAEGSAKVKIGDTEVIAGVKLETGEPFPDNPDEGTIIVNAEFLPLSNPDFESGPPGIDSIELSRVVDRGLRESKALDFKKLCIREGEKIWMVLIDIYPLNDDGNLQDAASLAALAALSKAKFPKLLEDDKIDYNVHTEELPLLKNPVECTVIKIGDSLLVDPTKDEEAFIEARLTVAVDENGRVNAMQKGGQKPLSMEEVDKMIEISLKKTKELREKI